MSPGDARAGPSSSPACARDVRRSARRSVDYELTPLIDQTAILIGQGLVLYGLILYGHLGLLTTEHTTDDVSSRAGRGARLVALLARGDKHEKLQLAVDVGSRRARLLAPRGRGQGRCWACRTTPRE